MIKLKRMFCIFMTAMIMLSVVVSAQEETVIKYSDEILLLKNIGLINEDIDSKLEAFCTRGEFALVMAGILSKGIPYTSGDQNFIDIPKESIYYGAVSYMYGLGAMNGHGDGTFRPEGNISYNEAICAMVKLLGYGVKATAKGGFATGYALVADELNLTDGLVVSDYSRMTYQEVLKLIYNALFVAMSEQTTFGNTVGYSSENGATLLNLYLNMDYTEGLLSDNSITSLTGESNIKSDAILVNGVMIENASNVAKNYLGYYVRVYYKVSNDVNTFVYISELKNKNKVLKINAKDLVKPFSLTQLTYKTESDNKKTVKIKNDADYIKNGEATKSLTASDLDIKCGNITLIDYNSDNRYDIIFINEFQTVVFSSVNESGDIIYGKYGERINLENCEEINCYGIDGEQISVKDLSSYDVLAVTLGKKAAKIEICTSVVYGTLDEINDEYYVIKGDKYKVAQEYLQSGLPIPNVGEEGTFYFGKDNLLAYFELSSIKKVGVAIALTKKTSDIDTPEIRIKIYTTDGKFVVFDLEKKIRLNKQTVKQEKIYDEASLFDSENSFKRQVVLYELSDKGYISSLEFADPTKPDSDTLQAVSDERTYNWCNPGTDAISPAGDIDNQDNRALFIVPETIYFKLPEDINAERFYSVSKSALPYQHNTNIANTQCFFTKKSSKHSAVADIVTSVVKTSRNGDWTQRSTVVSDIIRGIGQDGEVCDILVGYREGKEVKFYATDGTKINGIVPGDIVQLTDNENDIVRYRKNYSIEKDKTSVEWYLLHGNDDLLTEFYDISNPDDVDSLDYYINKDLLTSPKTYSERSGNTFNTNKGSQYVTGEVVYKDGNYISVLTDDGRDLQFLLNENEFQYYKTYVYRFNKESQSVKFSSAANVMVGDRVALFTEAYSVLDLMIIE